MVSRTHTLPKLRHESEVIATPKDGCGLVGRSRHSLAGGSSLGEVSPSKNWVSQVSILRPGIARTSPGRRLLLTNAIGSGHRWGGAAATDPASVRATRRTASSLRLVIARCAG